MMARHDHDSARPSTCEMRVVHKSSYKQCKVNKELAPYYTCRVVIRYRTRVYSRHMHMAYSELELLYS